MGVRVSSVSCIATLPRAAVDLEHTHSNGAAGVGARLAPTRYRTDACGELPEAERLHQVVVGPKLEQHDAVDLVGASGDHDDRGVGAGAELATDVGSVHVGEAEVEQYELGRVGGQRGGAGRDPVHVEAVAGEAGDERLRDGVVVLDEQDVHGATVA